MVEPETKKDRECSRLESWEADATSFLMLSLGLSRRVLATESTNSFRCIVLSGMFCC